jgi:hypothetical protein
MFNQPKTLLEQQCMTFCAIMKAMEGHLTEHNILGTCDKVWNWTKHPLAAELTAMNGELQPPPDPPVEPELMLPNGQIRRQILVTDIAIHRKGTSKAGKPYTIRQVTDEGGIAYTTWSSSQFELGKSYAILFKPKEFNGTMQREIIESVLVEEVPHVMRGLSAISLFTPCSVNW